MYKQAEKLVKTCKNYEAGVTPLLVLLVLAISSLFVVGGGVTVNKLIDNGTIQVDSPAIRNILHQQTTYLDAKKMDGSVIEDSVVGTVVLPNGAFSAYKFINGGVKDNGGNFTGETKIKFLSGDSGLGTYDGGIIAPFYLKDGTKSIGVVMNRMVASLKNGDTSYAIKILQGNVADGKLIGNFIAQTLDSGYIIGGAVDEAGRITHSSVISGAPRATEAEVSIAINALGLFKEISAVFGIESTKVLAESTEALPGYEVAGFNKPIFDPKTGTWIFLSPTAATTGVISTSANQNISNYLQNFDKEVVTTLYQNLPSNIQTSAVAGLASIKSSNSKLTITTADGVANLSLDLTGITAAGINDGTINKAKLVSSNDAANGQCLTYNSSTGGFTWSSCGTSGGAGTITGVTAGNGLTGGGTSGALSLALNIQSGGGLSATASGLSMLRTCGDGELLKWTSSTSSWGCAIDVGGAGGGISTLKVDGTTTVSSASILNFLGSDFDLTNLPTGQGNLSIDYTNSKIVRSDQTQSITGVWTFGTAPVISTISNTGTLTLPTATDTLVGRATTDTLTNKTIAAGSNTISGLTNSNLSGTAGITNVNLANSSVTINSSGILSGGGTLSLGGTLTLTATEADTLSSITGRGALTTALVNLNGGIFSQGARTGKALVIFDETGDQNILAASASGVTKLTLDRSGNLTLSGNVVATGTIGGSNFSGSHSGTSSGTNTGDQTITLTGNVTGTGTGSFATTIASGAVTLSNMANLAANSIIGNNTGTPGTPLALTASQVKTLLGIATTDVSGLGTIATQSASNIFVTGGNMTGLNSISATTFTGDLTGNASTVTKLVTARTIAGTSFDGSANISLSNKFIVQGTTDSGLTGAQFLGSLGTGIVKNTTTTGVLSIAVAGDFPTLNQNTTGTAANITGVLGATSFPAMTGDVTNTQGSLANAIASGAVTLSKMANLAANSIIGNNTGTPGTPLALTASQVKTLLGIASTDVSGLGTIATQSASNVFITGGNMSGLVSVGATTFTGALSGNATNITGVLGATSFPAMTGDVTNTQGSLSNAIATGAVTLTKMANLAANSIIGNNTGSPATPLALTASQVKSLLAISNTDVSGLGTIATQSASNVFITGGNVTVNSVTSGGLTLTLGSDATGDLFYRSAGGTVAGLADVATGSCLNSGGVGAAPTWGSCGAGSSSWSSLTAPSTDLSLAMAANHTTFTWGGNTGAGLDMLKLTDNGTNTGTGYVLDIAQVAGSAAKPLKVTQGANTLIDTTSTGALTLTSAAAATWGTTTGNLTFQVAGTGTTGNVQIGAGGGGSATPDFLVVDQATGALPAGTNGAIALDSTGKFNIYEGAWKVLCNKTDLGCGTGSGAALSGLTAATTGNTINNADNAQVWNWSLTTAAKTAFNFGENVASTNGAGSQYILGVSTLNTSTANPLIITAQGTANGVKVDTTGLLQAIGTGGIKATTLGGATFAAPGAIGGGTPGTGAFTTLSATTLSTTSYATISGSLALGSSNAAAGPGNLNLSGALTAGGNISGLNFSGSHSGTSSGTNTGDQTITLTGNVTGSGTGSFATTIASGAVTLSNMANLAANSIIGNNTGTPGTPLALTASQVKTLLSIASTDVSGLGTIATQSASNILITGGNMSGLISVGATTFTGALSGNATNITGVLGATSFPAMTGDVTNTQGSLSNAIASGAVTLSKMANLAANSIIGNNTGAPGTPLALTASQVKSLLAISNTDVSGLGTIATQSASNVLITGGNMSGLVSVGATTFTGSLTGNASTVTGLSVTSGKTLTVQKSITLNSADDTGVYTFPTGTKTLVATDVATLSSLTSIGTLGSLSVTGAITGATATNTINGLIINSGALSGITTINASGQITSTVTTGTAPFVIASTTNVANLNASSLNGATFAVPGAIGGTTPGTGAFTTLSATTLSTTSYATISGSLALGSSSAAAGPGNLNLSGALTAGGNISGLNFSGSSSGTNTGDQTITLTGSVTGTGTGSFSTTIASGAVTLSNMANLAANSIIGNNTGTPGTPLALTASQVKSLLAISNTDVSGLGTIATQSASNILITGGNMSGLVSVGATTFTGALTGNATNITGVLGATSFPAMTGDVTNTQGSLANAIASGAVTLTKMANLAANTIIGNNTGSPATPLALTASQAKSLLGIATTDVSGLGTIATQSASNILITGGNMSGLNSIASGALTLTLGSDATGDLFYRSAGGNIARLADVAAGSCLNSGGVGAAPTWGACGAGGGISTVQEGGVNIVTSATKLNYTAADFIITDQTAGVAGVAIDYTNSKITRTDQVENITGAWSFTTLSASSYATISASLALGNTTAAVGPGNLNMSGALTTAGAISAPASGNTINGLIISSGALSGITTINASGQITSTLATGTAPFVVASTTNVANLNASSLNGATFAAPGAIGGGTPGTGAFTTLSATGAITGATATNTINGLIINTGALSGITTINASGQITSTVTTGTAPFVVASTTNVANLNASSLNGATFAAPGAIGGTTPAAGTFTSLSGTTLSVTSYATVSASLAIGNTNAAAGPGHLNISGNLTTGGPISAPTATNTINGLIINSGALSGITTINASGQITSTLATGTAPFVVASTTNVANLNASSLNGATFAAPGAIGGGTPGTGAFTTLSATGAITGATATNTINGVVINSGAVSNVSTLGLSGAITGATATNTINGLIINSGALSGATTLGLSGAITGATATNTINGIIINSGAVSNVSTLSLSGAITGATATNTINGMIISAGAVSGVSTLAASGTVTIGSGGNTFTFNPASGPVYAGTAMPTKRISLSPEYAGATMIGDGDNNIGTMTSDNASASGAFRNYYKWTTAQATNQDYDIWVKVPVPMDFSAMAATPTLSMDTYTSDIVNGTVTVSVYDTGGAATCSIIPFTPTAATTWQTKTSTGCLNTGTYTAGGTMSIRIHMQSPITGDVRIGNISFDYLSKF